MEYDTEDIAAATADHANPDDENRAPADWKRYRDMERKVRDRDQKLADQARDLAFLKAGINPEDKAAPPHTQLFVDGYKGELTTEAITAEAIRMQILKAPSTEPTLTAEQQAAPAAQQRLDAAADGATPPTGGPTLGDLDRAHEAGGNQALADSLAKLGVPTIQAP